MANKFGTDILIQAPDPKAAAAFYVNQLGFEVTGDTPTPLRAATSICISNDESPLGPVLEVTVDDVEEAKARLVKNGCAIVKDEPHVPRCYVRHPFGLIYNLTH